MDFAHGPAWVEQMLKDLDRGHNVERVIREGGLLKPPSKHGKTKSLWSQAGHDVHALNVEVARRSDEEVPASTSEIEKPSRATELQQSPEPIVGFPKPILGIVVDLALPSSTELRELLVDSAESTFLGSLADIERATSPAMNHLESVPDNLGFVIVVAAGRAWYISGGEAMSDSGNVRRNRFHSAP